MKLAPIDTVYLWARMSARYGHAWASQCGVNPDGTAALEWRDALAGITRAQLELGIAGDKIRASQWPPSSTEFRALCLAIPSKFSVRQEMDAQARAMNGHQTPPRMTPFARLTWQLIDGYKFRQAHDRDADALFTRAYDGAREHVMGGGDLPPEPVAHIGSDATNAPKPPRLKRWEMPLPTNEAEALARFKVMDEDAQPSAADKALRDTATMLGTPIPPALQRKQAMREACAAMGVGPMDLIEHEMKTPKGRDQVAEMLQRIAASQGIDPPHIPDE